MIAAVPGTMREWLFGLTSDGHYFKKAQCLWYNKCSKRFK
jgi:hypothetical protein